MSAGSCRRICSLIIRGLRALPVVIVSAIIVFSYYVYCFQTVIALTNSWLLRGALYVVFHILLVMFLASYFACIFTNIPRIPDRYFLPEEVMLDVVNEKTERARNAILYRYVSQNGLIITNISNTDGPRFCVQCRCIKPDRSHHCSMCGRCVLRYDHHCPWIANCVHLTNYKAFILFLFYGFIFVFVRFGFLASIVYYLLGGSTTITRNRPVVWSRVSAVFGIFVRDFHCLFILLSRLFGTQESNNNRAMVSTSFRKWSRSKCLQCWSLPQLQTNLRRLQTLLAISSFQWNRSAVKSAFSLSLISNSPAMKTALLFWAAKVVCLFVYPKIDLLPKNIFCIVLFSLSDGLKYPLRAQATVETALNRPDINGLTYPIRQKRMENLRLLDENDSDEEDEVAYDHRSLAV
ncbi:Palmitoyltransferase [Aphelenchoides besseyi]|nr:Palmitoyltransferase [Aphelenchoides besseyi]